MWLCRFTKAKQQASNRRRVPEPHPDGKAAGQQPGSAAGVRGSGTAEAKTRPNVEVNRRAEGTSELNRRLGDGVKGAGPWNAAVLPEIMAGASQESKRCGIAGRWADRGAAGQQPGSTAGAHGGGAAEARARPNVEVNRRAEGTSELNRRLGAGVKGAVAFERCGVAGDYGRGCGGRQAKDAARTIPRWPSSRPATGKHSRSARMWNGRSQTEA